MNFNAGLLSETVKNMKDKKKKVSYRSVCDKTLHVDSLPLASSILMTVPHCESHSSVKCVKAEWD